MSLVAISSIQCGDEEVTEDNIGTQLAQAICDAENACCSSQGFPLSSDARLVCEGTAGAELIHPAGWVFDHDIAVACLKAAHAYSCRGRSDISDVCRRVFSDPANPATVPPLGPEGSSCLITTDCAFYEGLTCLRDSSTSPMGTCRKWSTTGGPCLFSQDCVSGDWCDYTATLTCMPVFPDGAACTITDQCKSEWCSGSVCTPRGCALY